MKEGKLVTIFGGSGFVGGYIVRELTTLGFIVQIVTRDPHKASYLRTYGPTGQVVCTQANVNNIEHLKKVIKGSSIVINLLGILYQNSKQNFQVMHYKVAKNIAALAQELGVEQLIHISALGINRATDVKYAQTKLEGEQAVLLEFKNATIIRPSIIFGHEDKFFNMFAHLSRYTLFLPLIAGGHTKFQPIYVGDLAKGICKIIMNPELQNKIYAAAGPQIMTFKEILQYILKLIVKKRFLLPIPYFMAYTMAKVLQILPSPILTCDQVKFLKYDIIIDREEKLSLFSDLPIELTSVESVVPEYLACYK